MLASSYQALYYFFAEGDLIADIFGKSDDEDEEFTGFGQDESTSSMKKSLAAVISDSDEDDADEGLILSS